MKNVVDSHSLNTQKIVEPHRKDFWTLLAWGLSCMSRNRGILKDRHLRGRIADANTGLGWWQWELVGPERNKWVCQKS